MIGFSLDVFDDNFHAFSPRSADGIVEYEHLSLPACGSMKYYLSVFFYGLYSFSIISRGLSGFRSHIFYLLRREVHERSLI